MPLDLKDDRTECGVPMRERYERFCGHFVETRNPMQALRFAFVIDKGMTAEWMQQRAKRLMADPGIMQRVQELRDLAAAETLTTVRDLLQDWHDIATADPQDIVHIRRTCCRHCYGAGFAKQWVDEMEHYTAVCVAIKSDKPAPDNSGGFGFDAQRDPNPQCPHCIGEGYARVHLADTTQLRGASRKLFKSAKQDRFGAITVELHDQQKAREMLANCLGALKVAGVPVVPTDTAPTTKPLTADEAGKTYLRMIKGGKA